MGRGSGALMRTGNKVYMLPQNGQHSDCCRSRKSTETPLLVQQDAISDLWSSYRSYNPNLPGPLREDIPFLQRTVESGGRFLA